MTVSTPSSPELLFLRLFDGHVKGPANSAKVIRAGDQAETFMGPCIGPLQAAARIFPSSSMELTFSANGRSNAESATRTWRAITGWASPGETSLVVQQRIKNEHFTGFELVMLTEAQANAYNDRFYTEQSQRRIAEHVKARMLDNDPMATSGNI